ncbi:MAG TPA: hypothetical protein VF041_09180 [Gemmatimonadaceae bacterium]
MKRLVSRRRGFALAVALAAIVIIGGLIVGVFFASTQEFRVGRNAVLQARSLTAAEYGLNAVLSRATNTLAPPGWNRQWNTSTGLVLTRTYDPGDGSKATVRVTGLGSGYFQVVSEGKSGDQAGAMGRSRIAAIANVTSVEVSVKGALTTQGGNTIINGSTIVSGGDSAVSGWDCPPPGTALPGIAAGPSATVTIKCTGCVTGDPPVQTDSAAGSSNTYNQFGGANWDDLANMADKTYISGTTLTGMAPVVSSGVCQTGLLNNWGDPQRVTVTSTSSGCADYYPIVHALGSLHVTGGVGQGLLLVDGDLTADGGFIFYGPVIVKGTLTVGGTGAHFNGGVLAQNANLDNSKITGNAVVNYSSCAVQKATMGATWPTLAKGRSWTELY